MPCAVLTQARPRPCRSQVTLAEWDQTREARRPRQAVVGGIGSEEDAGIDLRLGAAIPTSRSCPAPLRARRRRPAWLVDLGGRQISISRHLLPIQGRQLVQGFAANAPSDAVPLCQVLVTAECRLPSIRALPVRFVLRFNNDGSDHQTAVLRAADLSCFPRRPPAPMALCDCRCDRSRRLPPPRPPEKW